MKKKKPEKVVERYVCKWCNTEKAVYKFYQHKTDCNIHICKDCINQKYDEISLKQGRLKAILLCCHYLDTPFDVSVFNSINDFYSFGDYLKKFNLSQHRDKSFEDSVIDFRHLQLMDDTRIERIAKIADKLNTDLEKLRGELK